MSRFIAWLLEGKRPYLYLTSIFIAYRVAPYLPMYDLHFITPIDGDASGYWLSATSGNGDASKSYGYDLFIRFVIGLFGQDFYYVVAAQSLIMLALSLLWFHRMARFGKALAFITALYFFSNPVSVFLNGVLYRETFAAALVIGSFLLLMDIPAGKERLMLFCVGVLLTFAGFVRQEMMLFCFVVIVGIFAVNWRSSSLKTALNLAAVTALPLMIAVAFMVMGTGGEKGEDHNKLHRYANVYRSHTRIIYYYQYPELFNYRNSSYPDLLASVQDLYHQCRSEAKMKAGECLWPDSALFAAVEGIREKCDQYAQQHSLGSGGEIMDALFFEAVRNNPLVFLKSYLRNMKLYLLMQPGAQHLSIFVPSFSLLGEHKYGLFIATVPLRIHDMLFSFKYLFPFLVVGIVTAIRRVYSNISENQVLFWGLFFAGIHLAIISLLGNMTTRFLYPSALLFCFFQCYGVIIVYDRLFRGKSHISSLN